MKKIVRVLVDHLRIYPEEREVTSAISKTKGTRAGALVLVDLLPCSEGQSATNALQLSGKQIANLASMHGNAIRSTGKEAYMDLSTYVGVQQSVASITCEEHKKGDKYVDSEGEEKEYTQDSTSYSVNSIALPDKITDKVVAMTIEKNINWKTPDSLVSKLLGNMVPSAVEGVETK
jgi:hypothetical protein